MEYFISLLVRKSLKPKTQIAVSLHDMLEWCNHENDNLRAQKSLTENKTTIVI